MLLIVMFLMLHSLADTVDTSSAVGYRWCILHSTGPLLVSYNLASNCIFFSISNVMALLLRLLFKMIMVRNRMMTCNLSDADVSDIIARITVC